MMSRKNPAAPLEVEPFRIYTEAEVRKRERAAFVAFNEWRDQVRITRQVITREVAEREADRRWPEKGR
jgi:hypothetical protein